MTDTHNSGQHKDREAAAAEVRRMWQPTPSWSQPDPGDQAVEAAAAPVEDSRSESPVHESPAAEYWTREAPVESWTRESPAEAWSQPEPEAAEAQSEAPPETQPETRAVPAAAAQQRVAPQPRPANPPAPERQVTYRADELIQSLPLPREAPAERGLRSVLRMRPGSAERQERLARATAATAFRRPVTITVANPKGGSGKTPTTLLLAGALGQARGGGVVAWDNNELRGNMHLRTHDTNSRSTVTDLLQAMQMLTQPDARLGDVGAYLRHQVAGQYDVLTSATTTYAQIEARDFDQIHRLLSRFYKVLVIDTGNNEGSSNWREAMKASDVLVIPIKWKSLSCAAAVQMLEELDHQGPDAQRLIRRAVIAVSNGPGDVNREVEKQLRPYFESRAAAVIDIPTDPHIAAEGPLDHSALQPATRRAALELAARVAEQITIALNAPR